MMNAPAAAPALRYCRRCEADHPESEERLLHRRRRRDPGQRGRLVKSHFAAWGLGGVRGGRCCKDSTSKETNEKRW